MKLIVLILSCIALFIIQCQAACDCKVGDQACFQKCVVTANDCIYRCKDSGNACQDACLMESWPAIVPADMENENMTMGDDRNKMTPTPTNGEALIPMITTATTGTFSLNSSGSASLSMKPTPTNQTNGGSNTGTTNVAKSSTTVSAVNSSVSLHSVCKWAGYMMALTVASMLY